MACSLIFSLDGSSFDERSNETDVNDFGRILQSVETMIANPYRKILKRPRSDSEAPHDGDVPIRVERPPRCPQSRFVTKPLPTPPQNQFAADDILSMPAVNDADEYDDGGVDWDEALQVLDHLSSSQPPVSSNVPAAPLVESHDAGSLSEALATTAGSSTRKPLTVVNPYSRDSPRRTTISQKYPLPRAPSSVTNPPPLPPHSKTSFRNRAPEQPSKLPLSQTGPRRPQSTAIPSPQQMSPVPVAPSHSSSLNPIMIERPTTWQPTTATAAASSPSSARETTLPAALQFHPKQVEPVEDEYTASLIEYADLDAPLANGWTLFPHQKKAVKQALLMRRFILALDMGLVR